MKILCFLKCREGMSRNEFRKYYEETHAPLIKRLLPFYATYKRNFLCDVQDYETGHLENKATDTPGFDVITELTFKNREMYQKMIDALTDERIGGIIAADEQNIFDRNEMRVYLVDEVS